ncbi:DUF2993 domain-containing protein [Sphaerospermopsis aphanizomenoides BCCUSP55]|nr:DUF2993 domain-containing protein [Sphaerospermopsis aphanizomenoides BCCUSP55]
MSDQQRLEEQLLSQAAERRLSQQLDEVETINVKVQTDIGKIFQGRVDGVYLAGQGLVVQKKIRVQEINLQTDNIAVDPLSVILGQIKLNAPVNANIRLVLTEADINYALTSEIIAGLVRKFNLNVDGEMVSFEPQEMQIFLPGDGKLEFKGKIGIKEKEDTHILGYHTIAYPRTNTKPPMLQSFHCTQGEGIKIELIAAAMQKVKEIINLPSYEWENMIFSIKEMEVQKDNLILIIEAHVKQLPSPETILAAD